MLGRDNRLHHSQREVTHKQVVSYFEEDTPLSSKTPVSGPFRSLLCFNSSQVTSRMEDFRDTNLRSLLRQLRTDIAMAVDDSFPLVFGLADKNIITDQLQKVNNSAPSGYVDFWRNALTCCFPRTLWRKRAGKESTRQCTHYCRGSWNREDPSSVPSGATCLKTTTWTVTPSCTSWSQTCLAVRSPGPHLQFIRWFKSSNCCQQGGNPQLLVMKRDPQMIRKQATSRRGTMRTVSNQSFMTNQAMSQVLSFSQNALLWRKKCFLCQMELILNCTEIRSVCVFSRC